MNDLNWHHYSVARRGDEFSFSIDNRWLTFKTSQPINKTPFRLSDGGIYIAGVGGPGAISSSDLYYRGCLADVQFNDVNLHKVLDTDSNSVSFRVQRNCTTLFATMADSFALSFNEEGSFVGFEMSSKSGRQLSALHFEIRTKIRDGPLLYSSLNEEQNHFLRLDIKETTLYMSISNYRGTWRAHSQLTVSDGSWHRVGIRFHSDTLELTVDRESEKLLSGSSITPEIGEFLYFGAVVHADVVRKTHDVKLGAIFMGCLHNIVVNYEHLTTRKIVISNGVSLKCSLFGSCSDHHSSLPNNDSMQICSNIEESQRQGYVNDYLVPRRTSEPLLQPLFVSNSLFVQEGNSTRLELGTLRVFPQHHMFGLTNRNIVFQIIEKPRHGKLTLMQNGSHDTLRQFSFQVRLTIAMKLQNNK